MITEQDLIDAAGGSEAYDKLFDRAASQDAGERSRQVAAMVNEARAAISRHLGITYGDFTGLDANDYRPVVIAACRLAVLETRAKRDGGKLSETLDAALDRARADLRAMAEGDAFPGRRQGPVQPETMRGGVVRTPDVLGKLTRKGLSGLFT